MLYVRFFNFSTNDKWLKLTENEWLIKSISLALFSKRELMELIFSKFVKKNVISLCAPFSGVFTRNNKKNNFLASTKQTIFTIDYYINYMSNVRCQNFHVKCIVIFSILYYNSTRLSI